MQRVAIILLSGLLVLLTPVMYGQPISVNHFHKIIISPYIQATFVQGDRESVTVNSCAVDRSKLHIESKSGTLRVYLDGAKEIPRQQQANNHNLVYPKHAVFITVVYQDIDALSLRGEETFLCKSPLRAEKFELNVYGESTVTFAEVHIDDLHTTIYGESSLDIQSGSVNKQYYTCYGEGKVNTAAVSGEEARLTAYGEADFRMNVSDRIRITSFGDAKLRYKGNPSIVKGLHFGDMDIERLD